MEGADCKGIYREGDSDIQVRQGFNGALAQVRQGFKGALAQVRQGFNGAQAPPNLRKHATTLTK